MLGLITAWRQLQQGESNQQDPFPPSMEEVTAVAGRFHAPNSRAANDFKAALFIFLLILKYCCAKNRAKIVINGPDLCKFNEAAIFSQLLAIPHQMASAGILPSFHPVPNRSPPHTCPDYTQTFFTLWRV